MKTRKHTASASTYPLNFSFVCCTISTQSSPYAILLVLHSEHLSLPQDKIQLDIEQNELKYLSLKVGASSAGVFPLTLEMKYETEAECRK